MTPDRADAKWAQEKAAMMAEIRPLPRDQKVALIVDAAAYRAGGGNTPFMGSMATAVMLHALGGTYGQRGGKSMAQLLEGATDDQLLAALDPCLGAIQYMRKHPTAKCPCCGQVVDANSRAAKAIVKFPGLSS
jgi:hypothetical protein